MPVVHTFDPPERFVAGTVGEPGSRTFFLQARTGTTIVSVALEKQQLLVLAERVTQLLDEVMSASGDDPVVPAVAPFATNDDAPLEQPIVEEFRVGTMTLSWDEPDQRLVLEVFPVDAEIDPDADDETVRADEMLVVRVAAGQARAFCARAQSVVEAGRPECPFCGHPIDPDGHLCVRANGFRRREP